MRKKGDRRGTIRAVDCTVENLGAIAQLAADDLLTLEFDPGSMGQPFQVVLFLRNKMIEIDRGQILVRADLGELHGLRVVNPADLADFEPYDPDEA